MYNYNATSMFLSSEAIVPLIEPSAHDIRTRARSRAVGRLEYVFVVHVANGARLRELSGLEISPDGVV